MRIPTPTVRGLVVGLVVAITLASGSAAAQDPAPIKARAQDLVKALTDGDADAVANIWTPAGEYAREKATIRGRDNIRKAFAEHFKKKPGGKLTIVDETVRFLADTVAVFEGTFFVERDNPSDDVRNKFSALFVNADGKWHLAMLREDSEAAALSELAWLVGDWTFKTEKAEGTFTVQYSKKKTYLLVQTRVKDGDEEDIATQVIGIDPATGKLKSWTFESDGSVGTADWVRTDTGWVANITATAADGDAVKAVTTIKPSSHDAFTFQTTDRTEGGEKIPDTAPVKVTRVKKDQETSKRGAP
jgi:uncharacterized protein (TIGR02246 family)